MPQEELERDIFATGFYRQKARSLRGTMQMLLEEFDGEVPAHAPRARPAARRRAQDGERRLVGAREPAGHRRRHARAPAVAAARLHEAGRPGEDRARSRQARAARRLGAVPASADLARPPRLPRPAPALRGLRRQRPLPVEPCLTCIRRREASPPPTSTSAAGPTIRPRRSRGSSSSSRCGPGAPCSTSPPARAS